MSVRERQLARLLRALIACCALLFAFAPPSFAAETARDTSGWIAERVATTMVARALERAPRTSRRAASQQRTAQPPASALAAPAPHTNPTAPAGLRTTFDARHLYLDLRTLLC